MLCNTAAGLLVKNMLSATHQAVGPVVGGVQGVNKVKQGAHCASRREGALQGEEGRQGPGLHGALSIQKVLAHKPKHATAHSPVNAPYVPPHKQHIPVRWSRQAGGRARWQPLWCLLLAQAGLPALHAWPRAWKRWLQLRHASSSPPPPGQPWGAQHGSHIISQWISPRALHGKVACLRQQDAAPCHAQRQKMR